MKNEFIIRSAELERLAKTRQQALRQIRRVIAKLKQLGIPDEVMEKAEQLYYDLESFCIRRESG